MLINFQFLNFLTFFFEKLIYSWKVFFSNKVKTHSTVHMHSFFLSEKQPFILQAKSVKHCITNNLTTMMIVLVFETFLLFFCVFSPLVIFRSFSNPLHLLSADVYVRELRVPDRKFFYSANRLLSEVVTNTNLDYCYAILHIFDHFLLEFVDTDLNQYDI